VLQHEDFAPEKLPHPPPAIHDVTTFLGNIPSPSITPKTNPCLTPEFQLP
jgi:hypothetical protein